MKASIVLTTFVLACTLGFGVRAQAQAQGGQGGGGGQGHTMTGCLEKGDTPSGYKLTNLERGPKEVIIAKSTPNLAPHVGHKIDITGVAVSGKQGEHTMELSAIKMVSPTCP